MKQTGWWFTYRARNAARKVLRGTRRALSRVPADQSEVEAVVRLRRAADELAQSLNNKPADAHQLEKLTIKTVTLIPKADLARETALVPALSWFLPGVAEQASKSVIRQYTESIGWAVGIALLIRFFLFEPFKIPTGSMIPTLQIGDHIFVSKSAFGIKLPFMDDYLVRWDSPRHGDIVVFPFPVQGHVDHGKDFIKRVIGLPGDEIMLHDNVLYINGEPVPTEVQDKMQDCGGNPASRPCNQCVLQQEKRDGHTYLTQHCPSNSMTHPDWPRALPSSTPAKFIVPDDSIFVMGDNRDNSADGRFWTADAMDQFTPQYRPDPTIQSVPLRILKGRAVVIWWAEDKSRIFSLVE